MILRPSISVPEYVGACSGVAAMYAKSYAIKALAALVAKRSLMRLRATVGELFFSPPYHAAQSLLRVVMNVKEQKHVDIRKYNTTAMKMMRLVQSAHFW